MIVRQIKVGPMENFAYILGCEESGEAAIIDPGFEAEKLLGVASEMSMKVVAVINTHGHSDHIASNQEIVTETGAQVIAHELAIFTVDQYIKDKEFFKIGKIMIETIHTPGHSPDSVCFIVNNEIIFTGDTLFVSECGRTDLPGSSNEDMYNSLVKIMRKMPDNLIVYPGHDYGPTKTSKMGDEKINNYTLKERTKNEFLKFMLEP
tara:strand:- start:419 stop:1036 length:618 start_codon:yes stop_codon:yes gene_type:complete